MSIEMSRDVRGWFQERLEQALQRRRADASELTRLYLVELLARFAERPEGVTWTRPLAFQLADACATEGTERISKLRALGDAALYVLGFFEDHLERRGVNRSYVVSMGGRAYAHAQSLSAYSPQERIRREVYGELAEGFEDYVEAFDEVRESTVLRTPQDIVRLYEKWKRTRSPHLAERLRTEGVFLTVADSDDVLH